MNTVLLFLTIAGCVWCNH